MGCATNAQCPQGSVCHNGECIDPCTVVKCGQNTECSAETGIAICSCQQGFHGDPNQECSRSIEIPIGCRTDSDCGVGKLCLNGNCIGCRADADCGFGKACLNGKCVGCRTDSDCGVGKACLNSECEDPCNSQPCGVNAVCTLTESKPFKAVTCTCKPGYEGDANFRCLLCKFTKKKTNLHFMIASNDLYFIITKLHMIILNTDAELLT